MKAKHWFNVLKSSNAEEEFDKNLNTCMGSLCKDADDIIYHRQAKSREAIASCIMEVNNKWLAIIRLWDRYREENPENPNLDIYLHKDGFKAVYVSYNPKYKWAFDIEKHREDLERKASKTNNLHLHKVIPLKDITSENITKEILCCLASLGSAHQAGFPLEWCEPLIMRIHFLKYMKMKGEINQTDINEYEENLELWFEKHKSELYI